MCGVRKIESIGTGEKSPLEDSADKTRLARAEGKGEADKKGERIDKRQQAEREGKQRRRTEGGTAKGKARERAAPDEQSYSPPLP